MRIDVYFLTNKQISAWTHVNVDKMSNDLVYDIANKAWAQILEQEAYEKQLGAAYSTAYLVDAWKIFDAVNIAGNIIPKNAINSSNLLENLDEGIYGLSNVQEDYPIEILKIFNDKVRLKYRI